ncbi:MAG: COG1470 family protein [Candidatus Nitrosopumilus sp. bin_68KS]
MKTRILIISVFMMSFIGTAHASISITPFDLEITSDDFYEAYPNYYPHLIMKRGDSQQITIQVTNNDSTEHIINLYMAKETPRPDRNFVFEPSQLRLESGESATSTLTVSASPDANTGTTILHTLIAQSTSFGAKSFAFYVEITKQITPPYNEKGFCVR